MPTTTLPVKPRDPMNFDSVLLPSEMDRPEPQPQSPTNEAILEEMESRFTHASDNRRLHEPMFYEGLSYYLGNQWVSWVTTNGGMLRSQRDPKRPHKVYATRNKIKGKIKDISARALKTRPDASVHPLTQNPKDKASAAIGRALLSHFDHKFDRPGQTKRVARYSLVTGMAFLKIWWDAHAKAEVPDIGENGEITGSHMELVGELQEDIVPIIEIYLDPRAREDKEVRWLIHAKVRTLEEVQEKYGTIGLSVTGDAGTGPSGYVESRLAAVVGEYAAGSEPGNEKKSVTVKECWELPGPVYLKGRLITWANGKLLRYEEKLPYDYCIDNNVLPFVNLSYEDGQSTVYGISAVQDLISPQRSYNYAISRIEEHAKTAWGKLLVPLGVNIPPYAFDNATPNEKISYTPGIAVPQHIPSPELPPVLEVMLGLADKDLDDISGVHTFDPGTMAPDMSGIALRMLLENDSSRIADFVTNIETYHQKRGNLELGLARQFYSESRLIQFSQSETIQKSVMPSAPAPMPQGGIGQGMPPAMGGMMAEQSAPPMMGNPAMNSASPPSAPTMPGQPPQVPTPPVDSSNPIMQAMSFEAFSEGSCRYMVVPGSAMPKSPEFETEQAMELFKIGAFGPPGSPAAVKSLLTILEYADATVISEMVEHEQIKAAALQASMQPDPAQAAAVQAQAAQQAMQMQLQAEQAKAQITQQAAESMEALKQHGQQQFEEMKTHGMLAMEQQKGQNALILQDHKAQTPNIGLTGKLGSQATISAEEAAGLEPDDAAELKTVLAPKPAMPVSGGNKS